MPTPHLDGKHVVFGRVVAGKSTVRQIEALPTAENSKPHRDAIIFDCGELTGDDAVLTDAPRQPDALGDAYEDFPEDEAGGAAPLSAEKVLEIATACKEFGNTAFKQGQAAVALDKYQKALRYLNGDYDLDAAPASVSADVAKLRFTLNSNLAMAHFKHGNWSDARAAASSALDMAGASEAERAKALYRRGLANAKLREEDDALADLEAAHKLAPADQAIKVQLGSVKDAIKARLQKEKKAYSKFFN